VMQLHITSAATIVDKTWDEGEGEVAGLGIIHDLYPTSKSKFELPNLSYPSTSICLILSSTPR
jgi:hypothetical protein